ncbi:MAG: hypothetical protein IJQ81_18140, partial [Oscillibacter sp.]|nr:hypothetical protein [Oscillibacter sp.]
MPDNETPELIPRLQLSRNWENPADFATHQHSEIQNRRDIQSLFTEIVSYLNNVMLPRAEQLLAEGGGGGGSGTGGGASGDYLPLDGGTMRGILRLFRDPALDAEAVTKRYVDALTGAIRTDMNGNFSAIRQDVDAIELLVQDPNGIASLLLRADAIEGRVTNAEGDIGSLQLRADSIEGRVTNAEGDIGSLQLRADGFETRIANAEGDISTI